VPAVRQPLLATVLLLLVTGCGGGRDSGAPAPGPSATTPADGATSQPAVPGLTEATDLCPLITAADMTTLLGYEVAFKRDPSNGCSYDSVKADARTEPSVTIASAVEIVGNGGFAGTKEGAAGSVGGTAVDLPGIGDQAFTVTSGPDSPFTSCQAIAEVKGQVVTVVLVGGSSDNRAKLAPVAEKVLELAVAKV
jgi:hypothetical protein